MTDSSGEREKEWPQKVQTTTHRYGSEEWNRIAPFIIRWYDGNCCDYKKRRARVLFNYFLSIPVLLEVSDPISCTTGTLIQLLFLEIVVLNIQAIPGVPTTESIIDKIFRSSFIAP